MVTQAERGAAASVPVQRGAGSLPPRSTVPPERSADERRRARRLTALGLGSWTAAFLASGWFVGVPTSRGSVIAWALLAILASRLGDLRAGLRAVVRDFLPLFAGLLVYDLLRGRADDLSSVAHVDPQLSFDRALGLGRTPTERLQALLYDAGSPAWYDQLTWAVHLSHFLVSTAVLIVLWRLRSPRFRPLLVGLVLLSYAALATYWLYPAVPPWMASDQGRLEPVTRVVHAVWSETGVSRAPRLLRTGPSGSGSSESAFSDPVAALPSLHAALPLLLALTLRGVDRRLTALLLAYTGAMGLALVYGGEHYVFDLLLGWGYAWAAWYATDRDLPVRAWQRLRRRLRRSGRAAVGPFRARRRGGPTAATLPAVGQALPPRSGVRHRGTRLRRFAESPWPYAALAVLLRLPGLRAPARPDEAGYLLVAGELRSGGPFLYGDLWVDRPPLLIGFFRIADVLGGLVAARVLALGAVVVLVLAAADAGRTLGGARGGRWAALVAASLQATPMLGATAVNGELLGVPLVMLACAVGLRGLDRPSDSGAAWQLALAGAACAGALLVKQNLGDAVALLTVMLAALVSRRAVAPRRGLLLLGSLAAGIAVPLLVTLLWAAAWRGTPVELWETLFGFRIASAEVLRDRTAAPVRRAALLAVTSLATGIGLVLACLFVSWRRVEGQPRQVATVGVAVMTATAALSVAVGGSYWPHYLLQLVPATALAAALVSTLRSGGRRPAAAAMVVVLLSAPLSVLISTARAYDGGCGTPHAAQHAARSWLQDHVRPADTAVTLYGGSNALLGTGLRPAYPYLWSLAVRTLDPELQRLRTALSGPDRATWVVRTVPLHSWGLDPHRQLEQQLRTGYVAVATFCGADLFLRTGLVRQPSPAPE